MDTLAQCPIDAVYVMDTLAQCPIDAVYVMDTLAQCPSFLHDTMKTCFRFHYSELLLLLRYLQSSYVMISRRQMRSIQRECPSTTLAPLPLPDQPPVQETLQSRDKGHNSHPSR
nr:Biomphalaria glabrata protein still life; isoform SIF type 1-like; transcript variant X6 [Biomphalaria glabrata]